jgi:spore maturation protein B
MIFLSNLIVPLTFAGILMFAFSKRMPVYDHFVIGAKDGFKTVLQIAPTIIGLLVAVANVNIG